MATGLRYFSDFSFDPLSGELRRDGQLVPLEHQPSIVLSRLLSSPGDVVSRRDLAVALWGDTHVNFDDGINYCIRRIRASLDDDPRSPRFIETIPRRGYRFIAPVADVTTQPVRRRAGPLPVMAAAALILLTVAVESRPNNHHEVALSVAKALHDLIF